MRIVRTIFEHDTEPTHFWVQCRPRIVSRPYHLTLRLTKDTSSSSSAYEITDFRAPHHPEINWAWIDKHLTIIWQAVEFGQ